jgi:hypothetical protein
MERSNKQGTELMNKPNFLNQIKTTKEKLSLENEQPSISTMKNSQNQSLKSIVKETINCEKKHTSNLEELKRNSITSHDDVSMGNTTLHSKPEKIPSLKNSPKHSKSNSFNASSVANTHYNDTMFGDDPARTYSPNELDSLRNVYQNNADNQSDDEGERINDPINIDNQNLINDGNFEDDLNEESENIKDGSFRNYNATTKSEDDIVIGNEVSWDPNGTRTLPKEGNENNVIIEISNFTIKENSQVLNRNEIQQLFVGMEFLNYDPVELESKNSMPKPVANQPVHFNFRKSNYQYLAKEGKKIWKIYVSNLNVECGIFSLDWTNSEPNLAKLFSSGIF